MTSHRLMSLISTTGDSKVSVYTKGTINGYPNSNHTSSMHTFKLKSVHLGDSKFGDQS